MATMRIVISAVVWWAMMVLLLRRTTTTVSSFPIASVTTTSTRSYRKLPLLSSYSTFIHQPFSVVSGNHRHHPQHQSSSSSRWLSGNDDDSNDNDNKKSSVTCIVYEAEEEDENPITVTLFTKHGCTLCEKVKDVLLEVRTQGYPHTLEQQDITDNDAVYNKYKYDIPILHVNNKYWTKHKLSRQEAIDALVNIRNGTFVYPPIHEEPNAEKSIRKQSQLD